MTSNLKEIDTDGDDKISFNEFQHWLKDAAKARSLPAQVATRTTSLLRKRARRKYHVEQVLASLLRDVAKPAASTGVSYMRRRLAMLTAASAMVGSRVFMPAKERAAADKSLVRRVNWLSSTHFTSTNKKVGEEVALRVMERLASLCTSIEGKHQDEMGDASVMFEDPDFGPRLEKARLVAKKYVRLFPAVLAGMVLRMFASVLCRYDNWLAGMGIRVPTTAREARKSDTEHGEVSLYGGGTPPGGSPKPSAVWWRRPEEVEVASGGYQQPILFSEGAESKDAVQGKLGDCFLISAMSVLATRDDLLSDVFVNWNPKGPARFGIYVARFFKGDTWHYVVMDDKLPVLRSGKPVFARCPDAWELWVPFIEKGYAKLHQNYASIVGGCVCTECMWT